MPEDPSPRNTPGPTARLFAAESSAPTVTVTEMLVVIAIESGMTAWVL
ncbi:MAG: hypothetical protein U5N53_28250 [Mycobacterium sp.]|nr:hypothetical protein [Mycobacterium sp.]